jgi:hypothetical protein
MSAVSLSSSGEEAPTNFSALSKSPAVQYSTPTSPFLQSNASNLPHKAFQYEEPAQTSYDRPIPSSSSRVNGTATHSKQKPPSPSFQRSRTYSQPYISDLTNAKTNTGARPKISGESKSSSDTSRPSPRPSDVKPTRIPIPTRQHSGSSSIQSNPQQAPNGNGYFHGSPEPSDLHVVHETLSFNSSRSNLAIPSRPNPGLLNEPAPFKADSVSSAAHSPTDEAPSRSSNESEERPFEHWYRGEVSRNGGVGELRVGRRQEMLEIANYGHQIKNKVLLSRTATQNTIEEGWRRRKRAGSVSRMEEARERDSLHLDDEDANEIGRVLDEHPLTDLDGEGYGSEDGSLYEHYYPDMTTVSAPPQSSYEPRSTTPTPSTMQRSTSRQQNLPPPTRIPGPSSRRSSESRSHTPTPTAMGRGASEPPPVPSTSSAAIPPSKSPSPPPIRQRQQSKPSSATAPGTPRGRSPASAKKPKSRMAAAKATRAKTLATRKEMDDEANRRSVAYYPTPADGDELVDAIPSWTQSVPREGNWDDVSCCFRLL